MSPEPQDIPTLPMSLSRLASAIEVKEDVQDVKREVCVLTEAVRGQLAKQDVVNQRLEETSRELVRQNANTKERLVAVEKVCERFPILETQVGDLRTKVAKYAGGALALAVFASTLLNWVLNHWGGK